ncbi:MAG: M1 family aminopeptidase [Thermoanaerobaculia bacterium]|nr:M1 family aminopeptidase [Thermoanaerobaculia bacterium]
MRHRAPFHLVLFALLTVAQPLFGQTAVDPVALASSLEAANLAPERAIQLERVNLAIGPGKLHVKKAFLVPALTPTGDAVEFVLLGDARLELDPVDAVEAQQLELFTGSRKLTETLSEGVLVFGSGKVRQALLARPAVPLEPALVQRARELVSEFRTQPYRSSLEVDSSLLRQALGEPQSDLFFAGWLRGTRLGEMLYAVDPTAREQVFLGRFFPLDVSKRQAKDLERRLKRQQRRGRGVGIGLEDLGEVDQWLGMPLRGSDGTERPGGSPFEPLHYELDVTLDGKNVDLTGSGRIRLRVDADEVRTVSLSLLGDLTVETVTTADGKRLYFRSQGGETLVDLGAPQARGSEITLALTWHGRPFDRLLGKNYVLADPSGWYPQTGQRNQATYDVTLRWPTRLELVAGGALVDSGQAGDTRWERRRYDRPTIGYSFQVGKFKKKSLTTGPIPIDVYFDDLAQAVTLTKADEILQALADSLAFFTERYGPPPIDRLTVVTAVQDYSISWLGFITLSSVAVGDFQGWEDVFGFEDRRGHIAHEVAHQWWGHRLAGASYREAWLSEGLASYSALQYAREKLSGADFVRSGPTSQWLPKLTAPATDGTPIANLGPLVLGARLSSTRSSEAYVHHIYLKAPIVLDMLAQEVGTDTFDQMLAQYAKVFDGYQLTTAEFLTAAEKMTGRELASFGRRFLSGTDLPQVLYEADPVKTDDGRWAFRGKARQRRGANCRVEIVQREAGGFDIPCRSRAASFDPADATLVAPLWIQHKQPDGEQRGKGAAVVLTGDTTELSLVTDREPEFLMFDPLNQTWALYFPTKIFPRRARYFEALDALAEGRLEDADRLLAEATEVPYYDGPKVDRWSRAAARDAAADLERSILIARARLALDLGQLDAADQRLDKLRSKSSFTQNVSNDQWETLLALESRLDILRGRAAAAWRRIDDATKEGWLETAEATAVAAVAAHLVDATPEIQRRARQAAARAGVDTSGLETP